MDWLAEVRNKVSRNNQILFSKHSELLQDLSLLIQEQNHKVMVLWALEFADEAVQNLLEKYPDERRLQQAVLTSRAWAAGYVKMPVAQRAILAAHTFAKEIDSPEDIALSHAIGQACGTVHASGHAIGFPIYELTAIVRRYGVDDCREPVEKRKAWYLERLHYWSKNYESSLQEWAEFM